MMLDTYLTQRLAGERMKDVMREAEHARLIRVAKSAEVADQAASHGLLVKVRDLGLSLISVHRIEPDVPAPQQG